MIQLETGGSHTFAFVMMAGTEARVSQTVLSESVTAWLSSTYLSSLRAALLYLTKCFRLAPHDGFAPIMLLTHWLFLFHLPHTANRPADC